MKNKILLIVSLAIFIVFTKQTLSQGPGVATNPDPPDSSNDILWFFKTVKWTNPSTAISNKLLVGIHPDYLTELHSGSLIDSFILPSPLETRKTYYWRVDEIDSNGVSEGNIWLFTTRGTLIPVFIDSFSTGLTNWAVYNETDSCGWQIKNFNGSIYNLPPTAETYGICTDNNYCGNNRTINVLELTNPPDLSNYTRCIIGWDNDLILSALSDSVYVEVSKDGGINWIRIWERVGRNQRKSQEEIYLGFRLGWNLRVRFRSSLESASSWWAIDNFYVNATDLAYFPQIPPSDLTYNLNVGDSLNVLLSWQPGQGPPSIDRYRIQKKLGDSLDQYAYFTIEETDLNTLSFLDNSIGENVEYSYRVGICEGPLHGINSDPISLITVPVPVELITFSATISNSNVILKWQTATELNNYGFEILRNINHNDDNLGVIGFIPGHGTTTQKHYYSFTDKTVCIGTYKYKLKQIDFNGSFEFSQELEVNIGAPTKFFLDQNYPNPFNPITTLRYSVPQISLVKIKLYDLTGQEISTLVDEVKESGIYEVKFNAESLTSGVYVYRMVAGSYSSSKKMEVLK